jgi:vancomycin resistance protein VanJ
MRRRLTTWLLRALTMAAVAYPLSLLGVLLLLRVVGERWWVTTTLLYLPPAGFALPLVVLVPTLALARRRRLLALQLVSLWLLLFPLMGLTLSWPSGPAPGEPRLRLVSYNVNSLNGGIGPVIDEIKGFSPDIAFIQELPDSRFEQVAAELRPTLPHVEFKGEFLVASRFPIETQETPPKIPFFGQLRSPRYMKVVLETPLGKTTVFHVHTVSPRGGFYELRGKGLRREILSGRLLAGANAEGVQSHATLRGLQIEAMSALAARTQGPVLIVGDTNLPLNSRIRQRFLADFQDGFQQAGNGFGATFPTRWPWMRIDLVLANQAFRFTHFEVGAGRASDHRCVVADLVKMK